jgi:signal transduction histidine kinase
MVDQFTLAGHVAVQGHRGDAEIGFDPASASGVGLAGLAGLAGLRDRAEQVGGAVDVVSAPGQSTRVTVRVPAR